MRLRSDARQSLTYFSLRVRNYVILLRHRAPSTRIAGAPRCTVILQCKKGKEQMSSLRIAPRTLDRITAAGFFVLLLTPVFYAWHLVTTTAI